MARRPVLKSVTKMKFQPKRFTVEVKRGTSRAAFSSADAGPDKFGAAEAMLFGAAPKPHTAEASQKARPAAPPRRILESLAEAPAIPVMLADAEEEVERPRRGRKPGSKNKPKVAAAALAPTQPVLSAAALAFMKAPAAAAPAAPLRAEADPAPVAARPEPILLREARPAESADGESRRSRLRERSSIIQRYVLGTAPQPGQTGSLRARKLARAAASAR